MVEEEYDPVIPGAFAIIALLLIALEGFHIPTKGVFFQLAEAARHLASHLFGQVFYKQLSIVGESNDPGHVSRPARA